MIDKILPRANDLAPRKRHPLLVPFFVHYLIILLGTYLPYYKNTEHIPMAFNAMANTWFQWDSLWYLQIAQHGYQTTTATAFFPFVPVLIKVVNNVYVVLLLTGIAFFLCLYLLQELFKRMNLTEDQIRMGIWFFALNPCAFYYTTLYTEVWSVLFSLASLHMAVKGKWVYACLFAALLTSTRATTIWFGLYPLVLFIGSIRKKDWKMTGRALAWGLSILVGIVSYMVYLYVEFKDPLIFSTTQSVNWDHYFVWPWVQIVQGFFGTILADIRDGRQGLWIASVIFVYMGTVSIWKIRTTIPWERLGMILFTIANLILSFSFDTRGVPFYSTFRYVSVIFPIYGVMAVVLPKRMQRVVLGFFAIMTFIGAWTFTHHNWFA
ncbi:mannosyltransferase family protein [Ectobacillus polymachus]|uniref:mannosyltransferase family protein n=1 Tax=Ectobacillus polymachus TaxID=1508806 RepID=UPI003A835E4E